MTARSIRATLGCNISREAVSIARAKNGALQAFNQLVLNYQRLAAVSPDPRTIVILYDLEGFYYEEIARTTAAPVAPVKSRLSRGRSQLRDYLRSRALI